MNSFQTYSTVIDSNNPISQEPKPLCGQWFNNLKNQCQSYQNTLETGYVGLCDEVKVPKALKIVTRLALNNDICKLITITKAIKVSFSNLAPIANQGFQLDLGQSRPWF